MVGSPVWFRGVLYTVGVFASTSSAVSSTKAVGGSTSLVFIEGISNVVVDDETSLISRATLGVGETISLCGAWKDAPCPDAGAFPLHGDAAGGCLSHDDASACTVRIVTASVADGTGGGSCGGVATSST